MPPNTKPAASSLDPKAVMAIKDLELRARVVVEGFWNGLHRSPYHGFSVEFTEYRPYVQGDDTRYLDWKLYGRSDRYYLKKYQDETNLRCNILLDGSPSMAYGSLAYAKKDYAATIVACLSYFLRLQGDAVGLMRFDEEVRSFLPARSRRTQLRLILGMLDQEVQGRKTNLHKPLERVFQLVRKRGLLILVSDFLTSLDGLEKQLRLLCAAGHELLLFQVLDPAELSFGFEKAALFKDLEGGEERFIDPSAVRPGYLDKFQKHNDALKDLSQRLGIGFFQFRTNEPLEKALGAFLRNRQALGKKARSRR